ncbi:MAG: hypothetical protein KDC54_11570 [Lewinella sp.]|nr:hypothetical protein [Lewinella sp.]
MKTANFSMEGLLLIALLVAGLYGATIMLRPADAAHHLHAPQQETPSMVMAPQPAPRPGS